MNLILSLVTLTSVVIVHGQQNDKSGSVIGFPHMGTADGRFFMEGKRNGNTLSPGLIPFPRIGRSKDIREMKRQLIPFPRIGKRPYWRVPMDPYLYEYEEFMSPLVEGASTPGLGSPIVSTPALTDFTGVEENDNEKRSTNNNGGMWFGPRLGKRKKRSIEADTSAEKSHENLDTHTLLKILHNFNWAIIPIKERRTFTPRLGRSSDEVGGGIHHRSQPLIPRLGRSREVSSELFTDEDQINSRYSRSGNEQNENSNGKPTTSTTPSEDPSIRVPFQPRLGRDHIQPRLGRSGEDHD